MRFISLNFPKYNVNQYQQIKIIIKFIYTSSFNSTESIKSPLKSFTIYKIAIYQTSTQKHNWKGYHEHLNVPPKNKSNKFK